MDDPTKNINFERLREVRLDYLRKTQEPKDLVAVIGFAKQETFLNIIAYGCALVVAPDYIDDIIIRKRGT